MTSVLPANDRYRSVTLSAGQTDLPYDFELIGEADLTVIRERAGVMTSLVEGTDFIFPLGLGTSAGGTASLVMGAADGDIYHLVGTEIVERVSAFSASLGFDSAKFNADIDKLTRIAQEQARDIGRAYQAPYGETPGTLVVPPEGHILKADQSGNLVDGGSADDIADAQAHAATATAQAGIATTKAGDAADSAQEAADLVASIAGRIVLQSTAWDASSGAFPASAQAGFLYVISASGTVDGVAFTAGKDLLLCLTDGASTGTYAGNWFKQDGSDLVSSVAGLTGAITAAALKTALAIAAGDVSGLATVATTGGYDDLSGVPVKAWASFDGTGTPTLKGSKNIASITDGGAGRYTLNFTTAMANTNYAVLVTTNHPTSYTVVSYVGAKAMGSVEVKVMAKSSGESSALNYYDAPDINVLVLG